MDEKEFFGRLGAAANAMRFEVGDVRRAVWDRIGEEEAGVAAVVEPALFLKLDVAAALVIAAGSGMIYSLLADFSANYLWSVPLAGLAQSYF